MCVFVCFRRLDSSCLKWTPHLLISRYASFVCLCVCLFVCLFVFCLFVVSSGLRLANNQQERSLSCARASCGESDNKNVSRLPTDRKREKTAGKPVT